MKILSFALALILCANYPILSQQQQVQGNSPIAERIIKVGVLRPNFPLALKNPSEYCLEDGYLYRATAYSIGEMKVNWEGPEDIRNLLGKAVVVYGTIDRDLNKILVKLDKAPEDYGREQSMMQIRGDWVGEETGFHIGHSTHEKLKAVSFLRVTKILEFNGFTLKNIGNPIVEATFVNSLGTPLAIEIVAHYEFMRGKPRPHYETKEFEVAPGDSARLLIPRVKPNDEESSNRKSDFRLYSVVVRAHRGNLEIDLERKVNELEED